MKKVVKSILLLLKSVGNWWQKSKVKKRLKLILNRLKMIFKINFSTTLNRL